MCHYLKQIEFKYKYWLMQFVSNTNEHIVNVDYLDSTSLLSQFGTVVVKAEFVSINKWPNSTIVLIILFISLTNM